MGGARSGGPLIYRVEFHAVAAAQIPGLPETAFTALIERLVRVARDPWDSLPTPEPDYRRVTFGRWGLCSFRIDDTAHIVRVFDITWTG